MWSLTKPIQAHASRPLVKGQCFIQRGVGALSAVLALAEVAVYTYGRGLRVFEIVVPCVNKAWGVGDVAPQTNREFLRWAFKGAVTA